MHRLKHSILDTLQIFLHHINMETQNYTTQNSTQWIEHLALEEINMEESQVIALNDHLNPSILLEESSIDFVDSLRDRFEFYVGKFNQYRGSNEGGSQIRTFKISGTVNDFMLFRNSLRLIVARKANDLITIGFLSSEGGLYSARLTGHHQPGTAPHEIKAHLGPFNKISWKFMGEEIEIDALVKHYLSEFIRKSAR